MKTRILSVNMLLAAIGAAFVLNSCEKLPTDNISDNGTITIQFEEDGGTRTLYHDKTIWWKSGDQVTFCQYASVDGVLTYKGSYVTVSTDKELLSVTISKFNTPDENTDSYYCSIYPRASYTNYSTSPGYLIAKISTPATQTPTADSFDPAADLLISNYVENLTKNDQDKYSIKLNYYRQVALGKMGIINLPSSSKITSVAFSAEHGGIMVPLAGAKWYDFTTQAPLSTVSSVNTLTLDYSEQNISGDMTAHFCCYPFALGKDDWFQVVVTTEDGKAYTRKVTLSDTQELTLEAGRATQFTVDMSSALETDSWFTLSEYNGANAFKTTNKICFIAKTSVSNVVSGKFMAVSEEDFAGISDLDAYIDANGYDMSANSILNINNTGTSYIYSVGGLTGDAWYVAICKLVLDDSTVGIAITRIRTDWFYMTAQTRTEGGIIYYMYGKDLANTTRNTRVMATDDLPDGMTFETYYLNTLSPGGMPSSMLSNINNKSGATGAGYYAVKYYTDKTTQADMVPGTSYTVMIRAVNTRGETKFCYATATAGDTE